ncbi:MAG TPA: glycoside hydrolase family 3 C-terminal domain-containing protein [Trebonia sp.]|nr:glycoside hydrolase family 3 C-terminal domain-containing protein [Trebonia sp.]
MALTRPETLTIDEKAALTSGANNWLTKEAAGVPAVRFSDGPHGLRRTDTDAPSAVARSKPATCFPPAAGLAQSWDPDLARRVGVALARECRAAGVDVLLGPGVNIKRSPLAGRNFEYYSEDPVLTAVLATAWIRGVQSGGVGTSVKHFAANNAEHDRMRSSSDIDPRALREIYLHAFQRVVRDAQPWTIMCSYNKINGVFAAENHFLLTEVLRDEWGFDGAVVSDWGAVADRAAAVAAGCDLAMPSPGAASDAELGQAVRQGQLPEAALDQAVARITTLAKRAEAGRAEAERARAERAEASQGPGGAGYDADAHHALAREAAARSIALLKNDDDLLPLSPDQSIAVIGVFAAEPRYQGGGSSHVTPTRLDSGLDGIRTQAPSAAYAPGFTVDGSGADEALVAEAVAAARAADSVVLFLGLAALQESEGFDRTTIDLPAEQLQLAAAVVAANPRTVAAVSHGGVLRLAPLADLVPAILDGALLGQAGGSALADVIFGLVNPSGRLAETVPVRIQDTAAYLNFPGEHSHVLYGEGIFVGYRWHDARDLPVTFPFGHGLSYTTFGYGDLRLSADEAGISVTVAVTNTGSRAGREVVQAYVGLPSSAVGRAPRELKGFAVVDLEPGERGDVVIEVRRDDLAYWDRRVDRLVVEGGDYAVSVGASSRDLRASGCVTVAGDALRIPLTLESTLMEVLADPVAATLVAEATATLMPAEDLNETEAMGVDILSLIGSAPVGRMISLTGGALTREQLEQLLAKANAESGQ